MSEPNSPQQDPQRPVDDDPVAKPVITGLVALLAVAITVGILVGGAAMVAARMAGIDGNDSTAGATTGGKGRETLYLPTPSPTEDQSGPSISLAPGQTQNTPSQSSPSTSEDDEGGITLQGPSAVRPMENIDLTGVYPDGDGAILQVQRLEDGKWVDFLAINALVTNSTFSTTVQTSRPGPMKWRMIDTSSGLTSNAITVTVSS